MPEPGSTPLSPYMRKNTVVMTGEPGSGKTELAINLALHAAQGGHQASIIDLDVVTPLFRSRDATRALAPVSNVRIIAPGGELRGSDLPLVPGEIPDAIRRGFSIIDCGGGPTGARALASVRRLLGEHEVLAVINPFRPFGAPEAMADGLTYLQQSGRFELAAVISNPNLGRATSVGDVVFGHQQVTATAARLGVPVRFACARTEISLEVAANLEVPVLGLRLFMVAPWSQQVASGGESVAKTGPGS